MSISVHCIGAHVQTVARYSASRAYGIGQLKKRREIPKGNEGDLDFFLEGIHQD